MESFPDDKTKAPFKIGDRTTSDVVVRLRTEEGRDNWFYCHSHVLIEKSKYFADRLSDDWPTCQILDSRSCVEVYCNELDFNFHVCALRLLYVTKLDTWNGVRNTLGILCVAVRLGCHQMARSCMDYLEAVPWEEADEEEILKTIPGLGSQYELILARLRPVDPPAVLGIFVSAIRFATSSPPDSVHELKSSAQEQLEYMLSEDDDAPLFGAEDAVLKLEVRGCVKDLFTRFNKLLLDSLLNMPVDPSAEADEMQQELLSLLSDLSWACQILGKMEMMRVLVEFWVSASDDIVRGVSRLSENGGVLGVQVKVVEVVTKVLEAIGFGVVVLPTIERLRMVKVWLPFVRQTRALVSCADNQVGGGDGLVTEPVKIKDNEVWQGFESALVSIVLALPSSDQADILREWLSTVHQARYPDLSEAFEVWCYRSKTARRRFDIWRQ